MMRECYMERISAIKQIIPECAITTGYNCWFLYKTEEDHNDTLSLMNSVEFDFAYMFKYSARPGTAAYNKLHDDVPEKVKSKRLTEIIELQNKLSAKGKKKNIW